jgi:hypothetical protein
VADHRQYLRISLQGVDYLLSGTSSFAIEKREHLEVNPGGGLIAAWRVSPSGRAPAYAVDAELQPAPRGAWQRAVFLQNESVGLVAEELQLLSRDDVQVEPFRPLGPAPTRAGHLFNGAWTRAGYAPVLVFDTTVLASWLRGLERGA